MKHTLLQDEQKFHNLMRDENPLYCNQQPGILIPTGSNLAGGMNMAIHKTQCGSWCPKFRLLNHKESETAEPTPHIAIECGGGRTLYKLSEAEPAKEEKKILTLHKK